VTRLILAFEDQELSLNYPKSLETDIQALFGNSQVTAGKPVRSIIVQEESERFSVQCDSKTIIHGLRREDCLLVLLGEVVHSLITDLSSGVVLHSGALLWGDQGILLPGSTGAGKSCLSAWLARKGFTYLTDECVVLKPQVPYFSALTRPLVLKDRASTSFAELKRMHEGSIVPGRNAILWPENSVSSNQPRTCRLVVFPRYEEGALLRIASLSPAQAALRLTSCNVNARNIPDHGFSIVTSFARCVPAITVSYGSFDVLQGAFDAFLKLVVESKLGPHDTHRILAPVHD
jgi:hypothetical protein